ncbi:MAG TPA: hypothetical protein VID27_20125 [Blastocatellia bacterium]|jgi:hypothetical protein
MPTNIKVILTEDFIRAAPDGTLDFAASSNLLKEVLTEIDTAGKYHVLVDTRKADVQLSTAEIFDLAVAVTTEPALARDKKFALLVPPEKKVDAGFFEDISINRGANLRAFTDFETAITWLILKE